MAEYKPIRAHGDAEFWDAVAVLAELRGTSLGALVLDSVKIAFGKELALLKTRAASTVVSTLQELQPDTDHA